MNVSTYLTEQMQVTGGEFMRMLSAVGIMLNCN